MARPMRPRCEICRYWSDLIAQVRGGGPLEALCLSSASPSAQRYTIGADTCDAFKPATHGSVDGPHARAYA